MLVFVNSIKIKEDLNLKIVKIEKVVNFKMVLLHFIGLFEIEKEQNV